MKKTHRPDVRGWSRFDEARDIDFHSWAWLREGGAVVVDPLPISEHDRAQLGAVSHVVVTNSDHVRAARELAAATGATLVGPRAERETLELPSAEWVGEGDEIVSGLLVIELHGSKTPGELALLLQGDTLITGDLVRSHAGGSLHMLPTAKLADPAAALASVRRLHEHREVDAVLVGDGWPVFRDGRGRLAELIARHA